MKNLQSIRLSELKIHPLVLGLTNQPKNPSIEFSIKQISKWKKYQQTKI